VWESLGRVAGRHLRSAGRSDDAQGLTGQYLLRQIYRVKEGDAILFHATAGGVELNAPSPSV
jgi:hypothetical protein